MGKLLKNERAKLYKKPSTWVLTGILVSLMLGVTVLMKVFSMIGSSGTFGRYTWQMAYNDEIRHQESMVEEEPSYQPSIDSLRYLLDADIPPQDWRTDAVFSYFEAKYRADQARDALAGGDTGAAAVLEKAEREQEQWKKALDQNDWKVMLQLQLEEARNSPENFESKDEQEVEMEVLQLQLDLEIPPMPERGNYYYYSASEANWKQEAMNQLKSNKIALLQGVDSSSGNLLVESAREKLKLDNEVLLERLRTDTAEPDSQSFLGMMKSTVSSLELIQVLLMVLAGGLIASEFSAGTIKLLLITPHKRQKIYWSKALLLLEFTGLVLGGMFVLSTIVCGAFNGFAGMGDMLVVPLFGQVVRLPGLLVVFIQYLLSALPVLVYASLALMLSAVTRKGAVAIALSLILMFGSQLGMQILIMAAQVFLGGPLPGIKFLLFANTDLVSYMDPGVSNMLADPSMTMGFSVVILLVYTVCFLWIGRDSFCRRDVK